MGTYLATVVHNLRVDGFGRHTAWIDGYTDGDPLAIVGYVDVEADTDLAAADEVWAQTNRPSYDEWGYESDAPVVGGRSMCVGDLVFLAEGDANETRSVTYWAVEKSGFRAVASPQNAQYPAWLAPQA